MKHMIKRITAEHDSRAGTPFLFIHDNTPVWVDHIEFDIKSGDELEIWWDRYEPYVFTARRPEGSK